VNEEEFREELIKLILVLIEDRNKSEILGGYGANRQEFEELPATALVYQHFDLFTACTLGDYEEWGKRDIWTEDAALFLSLGQRPEQYKILERMKKIEPSDAEKYKRFKSFYIRHIELSEDFIAFEKKKHNHSNLIRSCLGKSLDYERQHTSDSILGPIYTTYVCPIKFVEWAIGKEIGLPEQLRDKVFHYHQHTDWKKKYQEEEQKTKNLSATLAETKADLEKTKKDLNKAQDIKISIYKILITMAICKYRFNLSSQKNDTTSLLVNAAYSIGIEMSDDTVFRVLKEAKESLEEAGIKIEQN